MTDTVDVYLSADKGFGEHQWIILGAIGAIVFIVTVIAVLVFKCYRVHKTTTASQLDATSEARSLGRLSRLNSYEDSAQITGLYYMHT